MRLEGLSIFFFTSDIDHAHLDDGLLAGVGGDDDQLLLVAGSLSGYLLLCKQGENITPKFWNIHNY